MAMSHHYNYPYCSTESFNLFYFKIIIMYRSELCLGIFGDYDYMYHSTMELCYSTNISRCNMPEM